MWEPLAGLGRRTVLGVLILGIFLVISITYNTRGLGVTDSEFVVYPMWYPWCNCFADEEMHNSLSSSYSLLYKDINMKTLILLNKCSRIYNFTSFENTLVLKLPFFF